MKRAGRLYRANRTAARVSLYTSLLLTGALAVVSIEGLRSLEPASLDLGWHRVDYSRVEEVVLLQDYLRIDTTPETGSELAGAQYLASILEREGIPAEVIDMGRRQANLIAVLEGDSDEALILHNHLDVDPIREPEKWVYPPFSGHISPPWIYGRGAFDMKSVAIAQANAMIQLKRAGARPARSIVFLATSGEETGSLEGTAWLLRERPELFERAWGVLTEGGVVEARATDDIKYWGTETAQKWFVRLLACSPSRERLEILRSDLRELAYPLDDLRMTPAVAEFLAAYASTRDDEVQRELLADPVAVLQDLESFRRLANYQQGLFRDELSAFPIDATYDGRGFVMRLTLALREDSSAEQALAKLAPEWILHGVRVVRLPDEGPAPASPTDHPIFTGIREVLTARFGPIANGPYYQSRSTNDSRLFRSRGIPSYGFSPFLVLSTDTVGIGGTNEGIALPAFVDGVELYEELLRRLVGGS